MTYFTVLHCHTHAGQNEKRRYLRRGGAFKHLHRPLDVQGKSLHKQQSLLLLLLLLLLLVVMATVVIVKAQQHVVTCQVS
jgi:hypothetical protein